MIHVLQIAVIDKQAFHLRVISEMTCYKISNFSLLHDYIEVAETPQYSTMYVGWQ